MKVWVVSDNEAGIPLEVFDSAEKARDKILLLINHSLYRKEYIQECVSEIQAGFERDADEYAVDDYSVYAFEIH